MRVNENLKKNKSFRSYDSNKTKRQKLSKELTFVLQKMDAISVFKTILMKAGLSEPK